MGEGFISLGREGVGFGKGSMEGGRISYHFFVLRVRAGDFSLGLGGLGEEQRGEREGGGRGGREGKRGVRIPLRRL